MRRKTVLSGVAGVAVGLVIGILLLPGFVILAEYDAMKTTSNGWIALPQCGKVGINFLEQAVCADQLPAVNVPQEAVYWLGYVDSAGKRLTGQNDYIMQFPPGGLPPNDGFWSVTMYYTNHSLVSNPIGRYWVTGTSNLMPNANGSLDIYIQNTSPTGNESTTNWLPSPTGEFLMFLRVYLPGEAILNGTYKPPPVIEVS
jgi:hypothetical protein